MPQVRLGAFSCNVGRMIRIYTNAFPTRRFRKRAIAAMVVAGVALMGAALVLAPVVPR